MVKVKFFTLLREASGLTEDVIEGAVSVNKIIEILKTRYGEKFRKALFAEDGSLKKIYQVVVNGRTIDLEESGSRILSDKDVISFLPPVGGG
ncbi:MAG: MoaD/ThiS family protein [Candidatus Ranarchaeia archaeon]